jgi:hypothetical protein
MQTPLYIIPAIGPLHSKLAELFVSSARMFGWGAEFLLLSDILTPSALDYWCVVVASTCRRGKDIKTSFANYIPQDHTGPVVLADADLLAVGPQPEFSSSLISACPLSKAAYDTFLVSFPDAATAREVGVRWHSEWQAVGRNSPDNGDVPTFTAAVAGRPINPLMSRDWPHPSIIHYMAGKAQHYHETTL